MPVLSEVMRGRCAGLRVLALGLDRGTVARFEATGVQAAEAIAAIELLAAEGFGES